MAAEHRIFLAMALLLPVSLSGCSKKPDVSATVSELEKAFPVAAAAVPSAAPEAAPAPAPVSASALSDPNVYVRAALAAARANDYGSGVLALEELQQMKSAKPVSANQLMTIEQAKQAMIAELVARADRGDPKAKADLAAIEKNHSQ